MLKSVLKLFISIVMFLALSSCSKVKSDKYLEKTLKIEVFKNVGGVIKLNKIDHFKWDRLLILPPYTPIEKTESLLNLDLGPIKHSGIDRRDDINQLIFFDGDIIERMVEYPIGHGDFSTISKIEMINRSNARFKVTKKDDWIFIEHY